MRKFYCTGLYKQQVLRYVNFSALLSLKKDVLKEKMSDIVWRREMIFLNQILNYRDMATKNTLLKIGKKLAVLAVPIIIEKGGELLKGWAEKEKAKKIK